MRRLVAGAFAACLALACGPPSKEITAVDVQLELPQATGCDVDDGATLVQAEFRALGDFAVGPGLVQLLEFETTPDPIDSFPLDTEEVRVALTLRGTDYPEYVGVHPLRGSGAGRTELLLPPGQSCGRGDTEAKAPAGSAVAAASNGSLLVAGGITDLELCAGRKFVWEIPLTNGLSANIDQSLATETVWPTATASGDRVVIAGGSRAPVGLGLSTFAVFDANTSELLPGDLCAGDERCFRRDHGAGVLPDGRVLLVGGRENMGAPLASAVVIDPLTLEVSETGGELPVGLAADVLDCPPEDPDCCRVERCLPPQVLTLDDGTVLVLGGIGADGLPSGEVYAYLPEPDVFSQVEDFRDPVFPGSCRGRAVALPGARFAWIDGSGWIYVRKFRNGRWDGIRHDLDYRAALEVQTDAAATVLPDGRILVTGAVDSLGVSRSRAFIVDVGTDVIEDVSATAGTVPRHLVELPDGTIAELTTLGSALRRQVIRSRFDTPPQLTGLDEEWLSYNLASHWELGLDGRRALQEATVSIPTLRFGDFEMTLRVDGAARIVLSVDGGFALPVELSGVALGPALCQLDNPAGGAYRIVRRGSELEFSAVAEPDRTITCTDNGLVGRVSLTLRFPPNSLLRTLEINRI